MNRARLSPELQVVVLPVNHPWSFVSYCPAAVPVFSRHRLVHVRRVVMGNVREPEHGLGVSSVGSHGIDADGSAAASGTW